MSIKLAGTGKVKKRSRNAYTPSSKGSKSVKRGKWFKGWRWFSLSRFGGIGSIFLCTLIGGAILIGLAVGMLHVYRAITTSHFFDTKYVDVVGNVRLTREELLHMAGVEVGKNSLALSIAKVERQLLGSPWVEEVSVKRLLPDRFIIKVKERVPSFWVRKDGVLNYANTEGTIIAPVETANFLSLPTLEVEGGTEDVLPHLTEYVKDLQMGRLPVEFGAVSAINITAGQGIELFLEDRNMRLSLATDDWKGNLERLGVTLSDLARRNELGIVREIRAADGNVWVIKFSETAAQ